VRERGCQNCRNLLGYTVVDDDGKELGEVWQERHDKSHPAGPHFGFEWRAKLADGTPVTGPWSRYRSFLGEEFCSRGWALAMMGRQIEQACRKS
jgi:PAS domain-containing protein